MACLLAAFSTQHGLLAAEEPILPKHICSLQKSYDIGQERVSRNNAFKSLGAASFYSSANYEGEHDEDVLCRNLDKGFL